MNLLEELEEYIGEFNQDNNVNFAIDSLRVEFSKQHKKKELDKLGEWKRIPKNSNILFKLKNRLPHDEVTTAYQLGEHHIYFYNMQDAPKYRKAIMVIFGMSQYHKEPPPKTLIIKILSILKKVTNLDICLDVPYKPNLEKFKKHYSLTQYTTPKGVKTQTHYINNPLVKGIEKVTIYNKGFKNSLDYILWRFEAKILVENAKALTSPLYEFKQLIERGE